MSAETSRHPSLDELSAWVDGEIGDGFDRQVLEDHVAACPSCASLVEDFRALAGAQVAAPVPPVPFHLQGRVLDRLAGERFGRRPVRRYALPLSAAATLLIGIVAVWLYRQQPASSLVALDKMERTETRETAPEPQAPPPPAQPVSPAPQAQQEAPPVPTADAPVLAEPAPSPAPALERAAPAKKEAKAKTIDKDSGSREGVFAPVPPQASNTAPVRVRQQAVALDASSASWLRLPSAPLEKTRRDEAPAAAGTSAPAEEEGARDLQAGLIAAPCAVRDLLRPPLQWEGMDASSAQALAERVRAAGARDVIVTTRLTLVVPAAAWPAVQDVLTASGIAIPEVVRAAPQGAECLEVAIDPRP